jgi:hypothetical protein
MSEDDPQRYYKAFREVFAEPMVDLAIETLTYTSSTIYEILHQLSPSYHAEVTGLTVFLSILNIGIPVFIALFWPLIDWPDALAYFVGLMMGATILLYVNVEVPPYSYLIGDVRINLSIIMLSFLLGFLLKIYISFSRQESDY